MMTPLGWWSAPTYKTSRKSSITGPVDLRLPRLSLLMSADIRIYRADKVPVGEDQSRTSIHPRAGPPLQPHVRPRTGFRRQGARSRQEAGQQEGACTKSCARAFAEWRQEAVGRPRRYSTKSITCRPPTASACRLSGRHRQVILVEPGYLLTEPPNAGSGWPEDSKSYHNTITLRESKSR